MEILPSYDYWNDLAANIALGCWGLGILIVAFYALKLMATTDNKAKYEFINRNEIRVLLIASIIMVLGACFYANSNVEQVTPLWITVRVFMTFAMGVLVTMIVQNLLKFYYPFFIEKRLKVLRYKPRISPKTGKPMKLLSEEEEDAYLDEGMQAEENIYSTDYDVWKDEETGHIKIEKYSGHLHAIQCPECNYQTFKVSREEIIRTPTATEEGELMKHYQCGYCGHKARKTVVLKQSAKVEQSAAATA